MRDFVFALLFWLMPFQALAQQGTGPETSRAAAWLGVDIADVSAEAARTLGFPEPRGAVVRGVAPDGPVAKVLVVGDILIGFDGRAIGRADDVSAAVSGRSPGTVVELEVFRNHSLITQIATLAARPARIQAAIDGRRWFESGQRLLARNTPPDDAAAREFFINAANAGHVDAMANAAWMYENGRGGVVDLVTARSWYARAADTGHVYSMHQMGRMLEHGLGGAKDYGAARRWLDAAAAKGNAASQFALGYFDEHGRGGPKNLSSAARWYGLAAEAGNAVAMFNLGRFYHNGLGVTRNEATARTWYRRAIAAGNVDAKNNLAILLWHARGGASDQAEARRLWTEARDAGIAEAADNLRDIDRPASRGSTSSRSGGGGQGSGQNCRIFSDTCRNCRHGAQTEADCYTYTCNSHVRCY